MYQHDPLTPVQRLSPRRRNASGLGGVAGGVSTTGWRTNQQCRADERRISQILEPPGNDLVHIQPSLLAHPGLLIRLQRDAYQAYVRMKAAAEANGIPANLLTITSGYRSVPTQRILWAGALERYGSPEEARRWVAPPGRSPHHTGRAIDLWLGTRNSPSHIPALRTMEAYQWLVCNAARFGYTPYAAEPWHWEYNPPGFVPSSARPTTATSSTPSPTSPPSHDPEAVLIRNALLRGLRDANRLTDMVFHSRHPKRRGQRLAPDERQLVHEWLSIRSGLVQPTLTTYAVRAQAGGQQTLGEPAVRRGIAPEDVSAEMVGQRCRVTGPFASGAIRLSGGEVVDVVNWSNAAPTARVQLQALTPFDIPKRLLRPVAPRLPGITLYSAGLGQVAGNVQRGAQAIANWQARRAQHRTPSAQQLFTRELTRLQGLQRNRERLLNRRLIQETMFNRFDPMIQRWTDQYNQQFRLTGAQALDPNVVKSMLFQES